MDRLVHQHLAALDDGLAGAFGVMDAIMTTVRLTATLTGYIVWLMFWLGAFGVAHFELIFTGAHP